MIEELWNKTIVENSIGLFVKISDSGFHFYFLFSLYFFVLFLFLFFYIFRTTWVRVDQSCWHISHKTDHGTYENKVEGSGIK